MACVLLPAEVLSTLTAADRASKYQLWW